MIYFKVHLDGGGWYYTSLAELASCLEGDCDGDGLLKWRIERIAMTEDEYRNLPDFEGH